MTGFAGKGRLFDGYKVGAEEEVVPHLIAEIGRTFAQLAEQGLDIGLREVKAVFGAHAATGLIYVAGAAFEPFAEGDIGFGLDRTGGGDQDDNQCESRRAQHGNPFRAGLVEGFDTLCEVGGNAMKSQAYKVI